MANVTFAKEPKPGSGFLPADRPLQEKYYAAGKVPGGFFKREARPTEKETLTARLIDRPIRPLFVPGFKNEVLVMCTVLSHDLVNDPDIVAMIAASAALTISGAPFMGPIAGCRVGFEDGEYVLNPDRRRHAPPAQQPRAAARPGRRGHQGRRDDGRIRGL
jgi:polyribonucleotide nucleotidyltransferase